MKKYITMIIPFSLLISFSSVFTGCSALQVEKVKAWEKSKLSKKSMRWSINAIDANYSDHVYNSKEASSGGGNDLGGGCGCE